MANIKKTNNLVIGNDLLDLVDDEARDLIDTLRSDVESDIADVRSDVADDIADLRSDVNEDITDVEADIATVDARMDNLVTDINGAEVTTLWTGSLGTLNTPVTLSKSVSEFDFIDIYTLNGADTTFTRVPANVGTANIHVGNLSDDASVDFLHYGEMGISLSGTSATLTKAVAFQWSPPSAPEVTSDTTIAVVTRIDGVKTSANINAELADVRVGADGVTYGSAGAAVRGQISGAKEDITKANEGYISFDTSEFVRGQIENGNDGSYYQDKIKLSTIHNTGKYTKIFSLENGYSASFVIYDDEETYQYQTNYVSNYVIDKNTNYRLVIKNNSHTDADHSTPAVISSLANKLIYNSKLSNDIAVLNKGSLKTTLLDYDMEMGVINSYGNNDDGEYNKTRKMRTVDHVFVNKGDVISIDDSNLRMIVFHYGMNKVYKSNTGWLTDAFEITNNEYVRIQFGLKNDSQLAEAYKATYRRSISIENNLSDAFAHIDSNINELQGSGKTYTYDGERIDVNKYSYDIEALWNFSNPTASGSFSKQCSAYSNGVVFKCFNPDLMQLYEFDTGTKIAEFAVTSGHGDSIDFSNEYYDSNDEFPLAYITADTTPAKVYVNRITRSGATLIRTLLFPVETTGYYAGHCLDPINNVLYQIGYKNNDYQSADNGNHMIVTKWDLASLTDNGDDTYTPALLNTFYLPFMNTTQGQVMLNGKIFIMSSNPYVDTGTTEKTKIYVVDVGGCRISNVLTSFIERIRDHEGEGVFFVPNENKYDLIVDVQASGLYKITL